MYPGILETVYYLTFTNGFKPVTGLKPIKTDKPGADLPPGLAES